MGGALFQRTLDYIMKRDDQPEKGPSADETAPGVKLLKKVWNIDTKKPVRPAAPRDVAHDIYHVPERKKDMPRRTPGVDQA